MKSLNIEITKAVLESFRVELKDGKPSVHATIALLTPQNKKITTYSVYTDEWHTNSVELPLEAMPLIGDLARILEGVVVRHCHEGQKSLSAPVEDPVSDTQDDTIDEPINLDDIQF